MPPLPTDRSPADGADTPVEHANDHNTIHAFVNDHPDDTSVHGIPDTAVLATDVEVAAAVAAHNVSGAAHSGATVLLTTNQSVAGIKTFRDGFKSRTVAGDTGSGSITMKGVGDLASGVIDWTHDSDFGYLIHLTTGPNTVTPYACIGIGIDYGGNGILLSNKATGRGLFLDQQNTISSATAYGMYLRQKSMAPLLFLEQAQAGAATCLEIAGNLTQAGDKLIRVSHATLGEYGTVDAHTGELTWQRVVTLTTASAGTAAIQIASNRTISFRNNAGAAYRKVLTQDATDKVILGDQDSSGAVAIRAGSTTAITLESNGSVRLTVDSQGLTVQDGKSVFATGTGGLKFGALSTHYMGFWGATPVQRPAAIAGSRGGNAALADLITKLAATGLITDATTA